MPIRKGDFILVDYTGRVKETGEVFDTTIEEVVKNEGIYEAGEIYEPKLIVVGEGWLLKSLDENLLNFNVGKTALVEIPPEEAFGIRDSNNVRLISLRRLTARGITPRLGMRLEFDGKIAVVRTIGAGRVQLDFNHPLAGKILVYEVTVREKILARAKKINSLIHRRIPTIDLEELGLKIGKTVTTITVPEQAFYIEGLQLAKRGIAMDIQKFFPQISTVKFVEVYSSSKPAEENLNEG